MWYTVNASGDEFVRMRIRCQSHPVRACDALTCTSPGGFSVPIRELQTLNSIPEYIFKHLLYGFRLVILLISYLYFLEKLTFAMCSLPHMWQWLKKSFVIGTSVAHFLSSEIFLFSRDMINCSSEKANRQLNLWVWGEIFFKSFRYTIKNRTAFFWLQCGFLIFIRFSK